MAGYFGDVCRVCDLLDIGPGATFVRNGGDDGSEDARPQAGHP